MVYKMNHNCEEIAVWHDGKKVMFAIGDGVDQGEQITLTVSQAMHLVKIIEMVSEAAANAP